MASIFTKIIQGDIPSYKVAEDDQYYAFLDINPLAKGHTLVIPREETDYIFDLNDDVYCINTTTTDLFKIDRTNLSFSTTGSSADNVIAINDTIIQQDGDQYTVQDTDANFIGTITQADGKPVVKDNFLYTHTGGFINKYAINFGTSTLEVLTRDSNSNFTSRITQTLSESVAETFATGFGRCRLSMTRSALPAVSTPSCSPAG